MIETLKRLLGQMAEGEISIPAIIEKISNKAVIVGNKTPL